MSPAVVLLALLIGQTAPEKMVTDAEKKEFFLLLSKLPTRGEFFTTEGVTQAVPHTRVLLALTEKDLEKRDIYPFVALSSGLLQRKEPRAYAAANFDKIAHPTLKLGWAIGLFRDKEPLPHVVSYLRRVVDSKEESKTLASMLGPVYEEFKARVIQVDAATKQTIVTLVKQHTIKALPEYGGGSDYTKDSCVFAPGPLLNAVRPLKQQGELHVVNIATGMATSLVPQPKDFKPEGDFREYFGRPALALNCQGDLLCRWTIKGNGDHALALRKNGADNWLVRRVALNLNNALVIADQEGRWYLIQGGPRFTVYRLDQELKPSELGTFAGQGFHSTRIADARFIAKDILQIFWGDVVAIGDNHLRMRCIDFDVRTEKWLHNRELFRLDTFVSSANEPTLLQLKDDSLHYLWRVDEGAKRGKASGLYYQAEVTGNTVRVCDSLEYGAAVVGDRIVVCYSQEDAPDKVYFRVIDHGRVGAATELLVAKGRKHNLSTECMSIFGDQDRVWFMNTLTRDTVFELKLVDAAKP